MSACLVPRRSGQTIVLDKAIVVIGRNPDCDVVLIDSRKVSRVHCCVAQVDANYVIRDLGSMNGVRVNGSKVREARIMIGDEISIGDADFVLETPERAGALRADIRHREVPPRAERSRKRDPERRPREELPRDPRPARPHRLNPKQNLNLSQEFPVAIPEEDSASELSRQTPPAPRGRFEPPVPEPDMILEFDDDSSDMEVRRSPNDSHVYG